MRDREEKERKRYSHGDDNGHGGREMLRRMLICPCCARYPEDRPSAHCPGLTDRTVSIVETFASSVLGGISSIYGAMGGGLIIGASEILLTAVGVDLIGSWVSLYQKGIPLIIMVITLLFLPQGIVSVKWRMLPRRLLSLNWRRLFRFVRRH